MGNKKKPFVLNGEEIGYYDGDEVVITDENIINETLNDGGGEGNE